MLVIVKAGALEGTGAERRRVIGNYRAETLAEVMAGSGRLLFGVSLVSSAGQMVLPSLTAFLSEAAVWCWSRPGEHLALQYQL